MNDSYTITMTRSDGVFRETDELSLEEIVECLLTSGAAYRVSDVDSKTSRIELLESGLELFVSKDTIYDRHKRYNFT